MRQRSLWLFGAKKFHLNRLPFWWFVLRCRILWYIIFSDRDLLFQWWKLLLWWLNLIVRKHSYVFVFTPYTAGVVVAILHALIKWSESLCAFLSGSFFRHLIVAQPKTTLRWFGILKLPRHILAIIWSINYSVMGRTKLINRIRLAQPLVKKLFLRKTIRLQIQVICVHIWTVLFVSRLLHMFHKNLFLISVFTTLIY